ncbi:MAG TPA: chorismate-binding protein [Solirubrobacteraceae bacterium]|nr:chorismate-binding protein [Solirubrobacteraceae bacterium]
MTVNRTLATGADARERAPVELVRVPLRCRLAPAQVLHALGGQPLPFALVGSWAGGGAIVGSEPLRVAGDAEDPIAVLDDLPPLGAAPPGNGAVGGGWFGWLGYRLAARVERVPLTGHRPVALPEFHLAYYDNVLHLDGDGTWWFEALASGARRRALDDRLRRLHDLLERVPPTNRSDRAVTPAPPLRLTARHAAHHLDAVRECRARIAAGEIFQANICLRLDARCDQGPVTLLRRALDRVAAPYAAAFATPRGGIVSLSPELFLRRRGRDVVTGPIKGTAPRDPNPAAAAAALERLRRSEKDAAEHVMIVDLMRNDIGRVCEYGSIVAPRRPIAEAHPGVWHLVSHVRGRLRPDVGDGDLLRATFPPGSVTGAPKVQSLRVIAELEPTGREVYTGAIGFASPLAGLELNVAIRTLELSAGRMWLGAGGGIVADSDPRTELEEALAKARPIAAALGTSVLVESGRRQDVRRAA